MNEKNRKTNALLLTSMIAATIVILTGIGAFVYIQERQLRQERDLAEQQLQQEKEIKEAERRSDITNPYTRYR